MKLGPVTKLDRKNMGTPKQFDDDAASANYSVIVIFPIYGWFGAIRNPESGHIVYDSYIFISSNLFSYNNWKQN